MVCDLDVGAVVFDNRLVPASVKYETETHIDCFLNYATLGLQIGYTPEYDLKVENQDP